MPLVITGATGHLGYLVVEHLLAKGVAAEEIIATGRDVSRLTDFASRGVLTRQADFAETAQLEAAFAGADKVLIVSTTDPGKRFENHRRAIDAARSAGVGHVVYVSTLNASTAQMILADAHRRTEEYLRDSGVSFTVLRNGWYLENYLGQLPLILQSGVLLGSAGTGLVSAAARDDLAAATAAVLIQDGHTGATYELGGEAFTLGGLAASIADEAGIVVAYQDLPAADYAEALVRAGLPDELARVLADSDTGLARGELFTDNETLAELLGRAPVTRVSAIRSALAEVTKASLGNPINGS